jgi:MscS family membrane protein
MQAPLLPLLWILCAAGPSTTGPTATAAPTASPTATPTPPQPRLAQEELGFLEENLPAPLLRPGPRGLRWWQWLALPVAMLLALAIGLALGRLSQLVLARLARRGEGGRQGEVRLPSRLGPPVAAFWALVAASALRPLLALDGAFDAALGRGIRAGFFVAALWGALRAIDEGFRALAEAPAARSSAGLLGLLPMLRRVSKTMALALGAAAALNELGFQVTSLLAGLGIGGLAVALAAQKAVENLIGSLAIGVDQPFRVGDLVQVEGTLGTVETVGMRSTRIRTLDRTLVTIPNGKLADMRIESLAARDRFRLLATLRLRYATTAAQLRQVLSTVEAALVAHPTIGPEPPLVRLVELGEWCLVVEVMAWLRAEDWSDFTRQRGALLLRLVELVEEAGASFAFPVRTVELPAAPPAEGPRR